MQLIAACRKNEWLALTVLSLLTLLTLPNPGFAENGQAATAAPLKKRIALPELSDGLGWKQPMYYSSLRIADIDGDGQTELLVRWINGLTVYRFQNGALVRHSGIPELSDNAGFNNPSWYSTIQIAALDSSRRAADVIVREADGIHVFRYTHEANQWSEIGPHVSFRPFADRDAEGTDWTLPKHYSTIRLADLTGDGVAELVGRGRNGIRVYSWVAAEGRWSPINAGNELSDDQGFDQEANYYSIQLVDLDQDGRAELIARAGVGIETFKWTSSGWINNSLPGPFGDAAGFAVRKRYKSVKVSVDSAGQAWLYGLMSPAGASSAGLIQTYRWSQKGWQRNHSIRLPGSGWDRESQFSTLLAADVQGDAAPEFLVRGADGLHGFTLDGHEIATSGRPFSDSEGWNLSEQYSTLAVAKANLIGQSRLINGPVILGRGNKGLEAYQFTGQWTEAAESNFPQYCTDFVNDNSPKCIAYKAISNQVFSGQPDIRSQYTQNDYNKGNWITYQNTIREMNNPNGSNSDPNWQTVWTEMVQEVGYVAIVRGWFDNNLEVLKSSYGQAALLLDEARDRVSLATQTSVVAKWLEFAGDVASGIAGFLPGGAGVQLAITILKDTYDDLTPGGGDITEQVAQIETDLNDQIQQITTTNINKQTDYLTDYSKLIQIGQNKDNGGFDWSEATIGDVNNATDAAENGMRINFYKILIPSKWKVLWCTGDEYTYVGCGPIDTPANYDCKYGTGTQFTSEGYISTGPPPFSPPLDWSLADYITGVGSNELNAISYLRLLGGDMGWDLPNLQLVAINGNDNFEPSSPDPRLDYIAGGEGVSNGCEGAGSTAGTVSGTPSLSARVTVAQQNATRVTARETDRILEQLQRLKSEVTDLHIDSHIEIGLVSPLREAQTLLERAKQPAPPGLQGSVSATTPTHLLELFVRRLEINASDLSERHALGLAAEAYEVMAQLEGQTELR